MPFAASLTPDAALPADDIPARISASGGLAMIREAIDKADWINHGKAGKELRLVTYRPDRDVTEQLSEAELSRFREDEPRARSRNTRSAGSGPRTRWEWPAAFTARMVIPTCTKTVIIRSGWRGTMRPARSCPWSPWMPRAKWWATTRWSAPN